MPIYTYTFNFNSPDNNSDRPWSGDRSSRISFGRVPPCISRSAWKTRFTKTKLIVVRLFCQKQEIRESGSMGHWKNLSISYLRNYLLASEWKCDLLPENSTLNRLPSCCFRLAISNVECARISARFQFQDGDMGDRFAYLAQFVVVAYLRWTMIYAHYWKLFCAESIAYIRCWKIFSFRKLNWNIYKFCSVVYLIAQFAQYSQINL